MNKIKWKSVLVTAAFAVITLLFSAASAKYIIVSREYERYRGAVLSRSYETLIEALCDYRETKDPALSERIAFLVSNIPLSRECYGQMTEFCSDISLGKNDVKAENRASKYCDILLLFLSDNRQNIYKNAAVTLPVYPSDKDESVPTVVMPTEGDKEVRKKLRKQAEKLLGRSYGISEYSRSTDKSEILGFRTVNSYAEYDLSSNLLVKAVIYSSHAHGDELSRDELISYGENFLINNGYFNHKLSEVSYGYGVLTAVFEDVGSKVTVSVSSTSGKICSFIAEQHYKSSKNFFMTSVPRLAAKRANVG